MPRELMEEGMKHKHLTTPWEAHGGNVFAGKHCIAICDTDNADEKVYEAKARLMAAAPALLSALKAAERFIVNGIEYGFIRMPDPSTPDSAHDTLPTIRAALAQAAPTLAADRGEG